MDVKGAGWTAAFPSPNVTVTLPGGTHSSSEGDEDFEVAADSEPSKFDFLGQNIDAGFRNCRNAAGDQFSTSIELAYLLAMRSDLASGFEFYYRGREIFKGVIGGRPYPVVTIYTERKQNRKDLKAKEDEMLNSQSVKAEAVSTFIGGFMDDEGIEKPCLDAFGISNIAIAVKSYIDYCSVWNGDAKEGQQREELLNNAESKEDGPDQQMPEEIMKATQEMIAAVPKR